MRGRVGEITVRLRATGKRARAHVCRNVKPRDWIPRVSLEPPASLKKDHTPEYLHVVVDATAGTVTEVIVQRRRTVMLGRPTG